MLMKQDEGKCPACGSTEYEKFDVGSIDGLTALMFKRGRLGRVYCLVACAECGCVRLCKYTIRKVKENENA